jgi:predicted negative regulator of RcsB-dependent stress response
VRAAKPVRAAGRLMPSRSRVRVQENEAMEDLLMNPGNVMIVLVVAILGAAGFKLWQQSQEKREDREKR